MTNSRDDIVAAVIEIIAKRLKRDSGSLALTDRLDNLGLDSFTAVEMIFDLEEKFDIQIVYNANDTRPQFETVGQVVDEINTLLNGKS